MAAEKHMCWVKFLSKTHPWSQHNQKHGSFVPLAYLIGVCLEMSVLFHCSLPLVMPFLFTGKSFSKSICLFWETRSVKWVQKSPHQSALCVFNPRVLKSVWHSDVKYSMFCGQYITLTPCFQSTLGNNDVLWCASTGAAAIKVCLCAGTNTWKLVFVFGYVWGSGVSCLRRRPVASGQNSRLESNGRFHSGAVWTALNGPEFVSSDTPLRLGRCENASAWKGSAWKRRLGFECSPDQIQGRTILVMVTRRPLFLGHVFFLEI